MYINVVVNVSMRECTTSILKRIHTSKGKKYFSYWIYIPKEIWSDSLFEDVLKRIKETKINVKIRIVGVNEEVKVKGPALITYLKE